MQILTKRTLTTTIRERGVTAIEVVVVLSIVASVAAAVVPACMRTVRISRTAEATESLERLTRSGSTLLTARTAMSSVPLTPAEVPRGLATTDLAGTWDHPTWKALSFSFDEPHWYSYQVDIDINAATPLKATARGDLNGNGVFSTFQREATRDGMSVSPKPGLIVRDELE